jgi:hypothetical protein
VSAQAIPFIPVHLRDLVYLEDLPSIIEDNPSSLSLQQDESQQKMIGMLNLSKFYAIYTVTNRLLSFRERLPLPQSLDSELTLSEMNHIIECIHFPRDLEEIYVLSDHHKEYASRVSSNDD